MSTATYNPQVMAPATWFVVCECIDGDHLELDRMSQHDTQAEAVKALHEDPLPSWAHVVQFTAAVVAS